MGSNVQFRVVTGHITHLPFTDEDTRRREVRLPLEVGLVVGGLMILWGVISMSGKIYSVGDLHSNCRSRGGLVD